jgi:uncharacterized protein with GYD domain
VARFLWQVAYTAEGATGLLKDGGTKRRQVVTKLVESLGGKIELFDFALGDVDAYIVAELPDNASAAAISMVVAAGGGARIKSVPLVSPEEVDQGARQKIVYTAPGR